jgi:preprotein translocase subunit SecF
MALITSAVNPNKKFDTGRIDFLGKAKYLVPLSIITIILGVFHLVFHGLNYGIDFAGGTEFRVQYAKPLDAGLIRDSLTKNGYDKAGVQSFGDKNEFLIRVQALVGKTDQETNTLQNEMSKKVSDLLKTLVPGNDGQIRSVESVGPQVGDELKRNSLLATFYSMLMILIYIGLRFDYKYAPGAVFCLIHDAVVTISIYAIFDREVNVQTMASILTLLGYSMNDTIITFDRVRENEKIFRGENFYDIVNRSVNDMLVRTLLTAFTTELAVMGLYFFSDGVIHQIAFTMLVGIVIGTYSSVYIAAPLVIWIDKFEHKRAQSRLQAAKA